MSWTTTDAVDEFLAEAGEFLHAHPARNTVILSVTESLKLSVTESLKAGADQASGHDGPLFGWWRAGADPVGGAFMQTPGFPVFLTSMTSQAAAELAAELAAAGRAVRGVNAERQAAEAFATAWRQRTGDAAAVHVRMRLYRLGRLIPPDPGPDGAPRVTGHRDRDLLIEWFEAFAREVADPAEPGRAGQDHAAAAVGDRLGYGGVTVWEAGGVPVSMAGLTRVVRGMARVTHVYTPPSLRGRGYAGAVTAAVSQSALEAGATEVVLYANLDNPTSNSLYQRLGYRPVEDRLVLLFSGARYAGAVSGLEDFARLVDGDHGLCVVSTLRPDGTIQSSVVNAGVLPHPVTGAQVVGLVSRGGARRLAYLRARPRATVVARAGWEWASAEGPVELAGPDDPLPGVDAERLRLLLREIFTAAGGTHDDWATYDRVMAEERRVAVLVAPERLSGIARSLRRMDPGRRLVTLPDGRDMDVLIAGPADGLPLVLHEGTPVGPVLYPPTVQAAQARGLVQAVGKAVLTGPLAEYLDLLDLAGT